jgi:hypothetical protein
MKPLTPDAMRTELERLTARYPEGSTVRVQDKTLRPLLKAVTGTVIGLKVSGEGVLFLRIRLKDSTLDTLPENVTLLRNPASYVILDEVSPTPDTDHPLL